MTYCSHSLPHVHFDIFQKSSHSPPFFSNPSLPLPPSDWSRHAQLWLCTELDDGRVFAKPNPGHRHRARRRADRPIIITDEQFIFKHRMPVEPTVKQRFFQSYCDIISVGLMYEYSPIIPYPKPISKLVCYSRTMCRTTTIFILIAYD